jgi:ketosteroid isomerase-like protein
MDNRSDGGAVVAVIIVTVVLLLAAGGVGFYFVVGRFAAVSAMEADQARLAEAEARLQAERARAELEAAASRRSSPEIGPPTEQGGSIQAAFESMEVESVLRAQQDAWNRGDLDAFMEHYLKSESLTFSAGGKTTRGWIETLNRYRERYPTPEQMGRLKFSRLEITPLGDSAALVLGQWQIERPDEPLSGNFSLVVRKIDGRWLIIHDHTSRLTE